MTNIKTLWLIVHCGGDNKIICKKCGDVEPSFNDDDGTIHCSKCGNGLGWMCRLSFSDEEMEHFRKMFPTADDAEFRRQVREHIEKVAFGRSEK